MLVKPKLRPNIEMFLIAIRYLENLNNKHPDLVKNFLDRSNVTEKELGIDPFDLFEIILASLELLIDIPQYNFSPLLSAEEYRSKSENSLKFIRKNYLDIKNNGLSLLEKDFIAQKLKSFYLNEEANVVPFFNLYSATKHDRIAYSVLASAISFVAILRVLSYIFGDNSKGKGNSLKQILKKEVSQENPKEKLTKAGLISQEKETLTNSIQKEHSFMELKNVISDDKIILPEMPEVSEVSLFGSITKFFKDLKKEINLDNKALETYHVKAIFKEITALMPELSIHRRQILTGYIAMNFGIIKAEQHDPRHSSYKSLNSFLNNRVKGIVQVGQKTKIG